MYITFYINQTDTIDIQLGDIGDIVNNGVNACWGAAGGSVGINMYGVNADFDNTELYPGDKLNDIILSSPPASMIQLLPDPDDTRGCLRLEMRDNDASGYLRAGFGTYNQGYAWSVTARKPLEWQPQVNYGSNYLCVGYLNGELKVGILGVDTALQASGTITRYYSFAWNDTYSTYLEGFLQKDPGAKGFRPTAARTTRDRPGVGGRGTANKKNPEYASDSVTQPGRPNESQASAVKSGFLKAYLMTQTQLDKICSALYSDTLLDVIKSSFVNPLDFIVSLMVFPTDPDVGATENLRFGKWVAAAAAGALNALGVDITGSRLTYEFKTINFGTLQIPENWGNFLDYSQTSIELYLPFIGSVNIDVAECMGGTINVQYTIDFFTGMCVANVLCERSFPLPSGKFIPNRAQHAYQGNCAIQIPLSAANYGSMVGSLINACTQGISNPVAGFAGIASDAVAGGLRPNISSKGNIVANSGFCSVLYPYVRITRPITAEPDSYQEVMGYPSYINGTLGQCEDLCICDEIDLKGITGATEDELNKIRQMCKDGVYV